MKRKRLFINFKTKPSAESESKYVKARQKLKKTIREAKRASEIRLANECGGDLKKFFGFYKFNKNEARIGVIENEGKLYHDDSAKANVFR